MKRLLEVARKEPARIVAVVLAGIALASAFGFTLTEEQSAAIVAFVSALLALGGGEVVRAQVTPNQTVAAKVDAVRSEVVAGPAAACCFLAPLSPVGVTCRFFIAAPPESLPPRPDESR